MISPRETLTHASHPSDALIHRSSFIVSLNKQKVRTTQQPINLSFTYQFHRFNEFSINFQSKSTAHKSNSCRWGAYFFSFFLSTYTISSIQTISDLFDNLIWWCYWFEDIFIDNQVWGLCFCQIIQYNYSSLALISIISKTFHDYIIHTSIMRYCNHVITPGNDVLMI